MKIHVFIGLYRIILHVQRFFWDEYASIFTPIFELVHTPPSLTNKPEGLLGNCQIAKDHINQRVGNG
jgi:hypothetical protein